MASKVSITNLALNNLGVSSITSMTEDSEPARQANLIFNYSLRTLLTSYPFNFAMQRETLAQLSESPEFEYTYQYQLPTDPKCLRVMEFYGDYEFKIEGTRLLTNQDTVQIKYIKYVTDMNELNSLFVEAFSYYLSSKLAFTLTTDINVSRLMEQKFQYAMHKARAMDAQEDTPKPLDEGSWVKVRSDDYYSNAVT